MCGGMGDYEVLAVSNELERESGSKVVERDIGALTLVTLSLVSSESIRLTGILNRAVESSRMLNEIFVSICQASP